MVQVCPDISCSERNYSELWPLPRQSQHKITNITKETQQQWRDMHRKYFDGLIDQVKQVSQGRTSTRSVDEYIQMRRGSIGAHPAIALTEYLHPSFPLYDRCC